MVCCGQKNNKFLHLLGVPRKRLRIGNGSDTLISPDLDHASVGKRNLAEQAQQKSCAFFMQRMPTFSSNVNGLRKKERGTMKTKKMAISAMFIAVGVLAGNIIYIPVGASKCFPVQHTLNILAAVFLGPAYGVINAFCISLLRNFMGTGSLLAFPGSMVGAFLAGMMYKMTKNNWATAAAEVVGTGVLGGLLAVPMAILLMGQEAGALAFVPSFLLSSFGGSVIAMILLKSAHFVQAAKKSI